MRLLKLPRLVYALATVCACALACGVIYLADPHVPTFRTSAPSAEEEAATKEAQQEAADPAATKETADKTEAAAAGAAASEGTTEAAKAQEDEAQRKQEEATKAEASAKEASAAATQQEEVVKPRSVAHELGGDTAKAIEATNAYGVLTQAIGTMEDAGYTVAFVVHDLTTNHRIVYNADQELYPASSIKAPFTCSVYQKLVETGKVAIEAVEPVASATILESSDEGYRTLHSNYGEQHFIEWLKDAGVGPGSYQTYDAMVAWNYPHISATQFALMWDHVYAYLATETAPAKQLAGYLEKREVSAVRDALGTKLRTWSKMGWIESEGAYRSEPATVEGGVVFDEGGPYVFAVMTSMPAQINALVPLHQAIYRAHQDMLA